MSRNDGPLGGRAPENRPCAHFGALFSLAGWVVSPQVTWEVTCGDCPHLTDIEHPCCLMTLYCVRPNQVSVYLSLWPKVPWHTGQRGNWPSLNDLVLFPNSGQIRDECLGIHPSVHSASINRVLTICPVLSCVLKTKQWVRKAPVQASRMIKHSGKDKQNTKHFRVVVSTIKESNSTWRQEIKSKHMERFTWAEAQDTPPWEGEAKTQRMRSTHYVKTGASIPPSGGSCMQSLEHGEQLSRFKP